MLALQQQTEQVARLADKELIASLLRVLSQERGIHTRLLVHIGEVYRFTQPLLVGDRLFVPSCEPDNGPSALEMYDIVSAL